MLESCKNNDEDDTFPIDYRKRICSSRLDAHQTSALFSLWCLLMLSVGGLFGGSCEIIVWGGFNKKNKTLNYIIFELRTCFFVHSWAVLMYAYVCVCGRLRKCIKIRKNRQNKLVLSLFFNINQHVWVCACVRVCVRVLPSVIAQLTWVRYN